MKNIYFVTEGSTDQIVIQGLVEHWLGGEDFIPRQIQPLSSAYAEELDSNLSEGWKGVLAWCSGQRMGARPGATKHSDRRIASLFTWMPM